MSAVLVRPAHRDDLDAVRRVLVETWHDTYGALLGRDKVTEITDEWHAISALSSQLDGPDSSFLLAERGGEIVGHAFGHARQPPTLFVARLYVLPPHQRQGIGAELLAALIARHPATSRLRLMVEERQGRSVLPGSGLRHWRRGHGGRAAELAHGARDHPVTNGPFVEHDLAIVRRAYARQMLAVAGVADDPRLEEAFATEPRERYFGPPPWQISRPWVGYLALPSADPVLAYQDVLRPLAGAGRQQR